MTFFLSAIIAVVTDEITQCRQFSFKNPLLFIKFHFIVLLQNTEELECRFWAVFLYFFQYLEFWNCHLCFMSLKFVWLCLFYWFFFFFLLLFLPIFTPFLWQVLWTVVLHYQFLGKLTVSTCDSFWFSET